MLSDLFWAASYLLAFLGSMSFGYLTLRYSIPDVRTVPTQSKLGMAGILGLAFFVISTVLSILFGKPMLFVGLPALAFITCVCLEIKHRYLSRTMEVALPVVSAPKTEQKPAELKCKKCGVRYTEGDFYCGNCGSKL